MLYKYEWRITKELLDILGNENLRSAPAGRVIEFGEYSFSMVAKLFGEEIVLSWADSHGETVFITITNWKERCPLVVEVFAAAIRATVEG